MRLVSDRLLIRRQDGYFPRAADIVELRHLYELRVTLELRGISRVIEEPIEHDRVRLLEIREQWRALEADPPAPSADFVRHDEAFHLGLAKASGNDAVVEALATVNLRIRSARMHDFLTEDRMRTTIAEHLGIVELLILGSADEALAALHEHVGASMEVVEQRVTAAVTAMLSRTRSDR